MDPDIGKPLAELSLADWNRQIDVNLTSVFLGRRSAAAAMIRSGGGSIVNLSSVAGLIGLPNCSAYAASKVGVRLMTKALCAELGKRNIRCNSVHPGVIWTNMQAGAGGGNREAAERMTSSLPPRAGGRSARYRQRHSVSRLRRVELRHRRRIQRRRGNDGGLTVFHALCPARRRPLTLASGSRARDIGRGDRRWAEASPTRSGPEGSSRNEIVFGSSAGLHLFPLPLAAFSPQAR